MSLMTLRTAHRLAPAAAAWVISRVRERERELCNLEHELVVPDRVDGVARDGLALLLGTVDRNATQLDLDLRTGAQVGRTHVLTRDQLHTTTIHQ